MSEVTEMNGDYVKKVRDDMLLEIEKVQKGIYEKLISMPILPIFFNISLVYKPMIVDLRENIEKKLRENKINPKYITEIKLDKMTGEFGSPIQRPCSHTKGLEQLHLKELMQLGLENDWKNTAHKLFTGSFEDMQLWKVKREGLLERLKEELLKNQSQHYINSVFLRIPKGTEYKTWGDADKDAIFLSYELGCERFNFGVDARPEIRNWIGKL